MSGWRIPKGGHIDRARGLQFSWAGRQYSGYVGDTLASALIANGISIVGRSFKYHRPRGLLAAGYEEPNGIVQVGYGSDALPNLKATQVELYDGLAASPVNARPSLNFDLLAVNGLFKRFIPAAFYYKTFIWPNWRLFEPAIRKAAGLGVAPTAADPDTYEHRFAHVDVLVVGGGAAGIAAAREAARSGKQVMLVEAEALLGGWLLSSMEGLEGKSADEWLQVNVAELEADDRVHILSRTMAFAYYDHNLVGLCERVTDHLPPSQSSGIRQRLWKVRAKQVFLATGAIERPIPFANNDLPGIMLASAAQVYARRYGVAVGHRVVIVTNNDSAYETARALSAAGVTIAAIVDSHPDSGKLAEVAASSGIRIIHGAHPVRAHGRKRIKSVRISTGETIECDTLLTSGGWSPVVHLHSQSGGELYFDDLSHSFLPVTGSGQGVCVGGASGGFGLGDVVANARAVFRSDPIAIEPLPTAPSSAFPDGASDASEAWLDYQNDVTVGDVQLAVRENFRSVEHVKRYTTLGMASDQGKTSNVLGIGVMSDLLQKTPGAVGTTRFRPPYDPVTIGAFAGRAVGENLVPSLRLSAHDEQVKAGARMEDYGAWLRPPAFCRPGEDEASAIAREVCAVRSGVGLFEASPLGKIEVRGPDAGEFLDRMFVNRINTLKPGACRYSVMLNENGVVFDDGVVARLADDHFLVGTTSGHANAIADAFEEWLQCEWVDLKVVVENVTTGWAVMNVAGPLARDLIAVVGTDIDLSADAFPHMTYREGHIAGVRTRMQRVSFTGELSYEISVPFGFGASLWRTLMEVGERYKITPFGVESLMVMRVEKGFLHVGADTDGTTLPQDIGLGAIVAKKPGDFVGRRSTMRPDGVRNDRRQLVGIEVTDSGGELNSGAHVLPLDAAIPRGTDGWVTSAVNSPTLGRPLAMALVKNGASRLGHDVRIWDMGVWRSARIVDRVFFDPEGRKLNA